MNPVVEAFRRSCEQTHPRLMRPGAPSDDWDSSRTIGALAARDNFCLAAFLFLFYLSVNKSTDTYVGQKRRVVKAR